MKLSLNNNNRIIYIFLFLIIILGFYLCFIGGYGSDEDTLPLIYVFEQRLSVGKFASSRFTGYPVPEIGIGFLSYYLGSWAANSVTYLFLIFGILFIYEALKNQKVKNHNIFIFLLLCLSNPILFFDNLEPIDYSWALFFYGLGLYCLRKNLFELTVIFFGICIGSRLNFVVFVILSIYFFPAILQNLKLNRKITLILSSFFVGGLFYVPIWMENSFALNWLTAGRPLEQGIEGLFARFTYKSFLALGGIIIIYIFFIIYRNKSKIKDLYCYKFLITVVISNLIIFFWIPAELSYIQLFLILVYFLLVNIAKTNFIFILAFLNLTTWIVNLDFVKIEHRYADKCKPIQAVGVDFEPHFKDGYFLKFIKTRDMIECWVHGESERNSKILSGKALKP